MKDVDCTVKHCKHELDAYIAYEKKYADVIAKSIQAKIKAYKADKSMPADLKAVYSTTKKHWSIFAGSPSKKQKKTYTVMLSCRGEDPSFPWIAAALRIVH